MISTVVAGVVSLVSLLAGFGLGRVKNASKLKAISTEISKAKASASAEVSALVAKIEAHIKGIKL